MYYKDRNTITVPIDASSSDTEYLIRQDLRDVGLENGAGIYIVKADGVPTTTFGFF